MVLSDSSTVQKFGFVTICGLPNVGKSTLLNNLVDKKVTAVSHKPQTTRFNILNIFEADTTQIAFVDTPGLFNPKHPIDKFLRKNSYHAIQNADLILVVIDISSKNLAESHTLLKSLLEQYAPESQFFIVFNKSDKIKSNEIIPKVSEFQNYPSISEFFIISAEKKTGVEELKTKIIESIPSKDWMYPPQSSIKQDIRRWAAELTMEQIFRNLNGEIPYQTYIEPLHLEEAEDGLHIYQNIIVAKNSQKPIIIGHKGQMLKLIGIAARMNIARVMKRRVHLHLFIKVIPNWMQSRSSLRDAGLLEE